MQRVFIHTTSSTYTYNYYFYINEYLLYATSTISYSEYLLYAASTYSI